MVSGLVIHRPSVHPAPMGEFSLVDGPASDLLVWRIYTEARLIVLKQALAG